VIDGPEAVEQLVDLIAVGTFGIDLSMPIHPLISRIASRFFIANP